MSSFSSFEGENVTEIETIEHFEDYEPILSIVDAWTKSGVASCVQVKSSVSNDNFLFDCGLVEKNSAGAKVVFITHGHIDHSGACINHARARALSYLGKKNLEEVKNLIPVYYVPIEIKETLERAQKLYEELDGREIPMFIRGVQPGDELVISPTITVKVFKTVHRVPSVGYAVYVKHKKKLKKEFIHMSKEIFNKNNKNLLINYDNYFIPEKYKLELVYTGDTNVEGLLLEENKFLFSAFYFITELTYLDGPYQKAKDYFHLHIDDIKDNLTLFKNVKQLIFVHFSQRYSTGRIMDLLKQSLPLGLLEKIYLNLTMFGTNVPLTKLLNDHFRRNNYYKNVPGFGYADNRSEHRLKKYIKYNENENP